MAVNHPWASTISFADGHVVLHKWVEERTVRYFKNRRGEGNTIIRLVTIDSGTIGDSPDIDWTNRNIGAIFP